MEVKIGIQNATRELVIFSEKTGEDLETTVSKALSGDDSILVLSDAKGRKVIVPTDKLAYVEVGSPSAGQVGFRS